MKRGLGRRYVTPDQGSSEFLRTTRFFDDVAYGDFIVPSLTSYSLSPITTSSINCSVHTVVTNAQAAPYSSLSNCDVSTSSLQNHMTYSPRNMLTNSSKNQTSAESTSSSVVIVPIQGCCILCSRQTILVLVYPFIQFFL